MNKEILSTSSYQSQSPTQYQSPSPTQYQSPSPTQTFRKKLFDMISLNKTRINKGEEKRETEETQKETQKETEETQKETQKETEETQKETEETQKETEKEKEKEREREAEEIKKQLYIFLVFLQYYTDSLQFCSYSNAYSLMCKKNSKMYDFIIKLQKYSNKIIASHTKLFEKNGKRTDKLEVYNIKTYFPIYISCKNINDKDNTCLLLKFFLKFYMYDINDRIKTNYVNIFFKLETTYTYSFEHAIHSGLVYILGFNKYKKCSYNTNAISRIENCKNIKTGNNDTNLNIVRNSSIDNNMDDSNNNRINSNDDIDIYDNKLIENIKKEEQEQQEEKNITEKECNCKLITGCNEDPKILKYINVFGITDNEVLNNKNIEIQNNDISIGFYDKYMRNGDEIYVPESIINLFFEITDSSYKNNLYDIINDNDESLYNLYSSNSHEYTKFFSSKSKSLKNFFYKSNRYINKNVDNEKNMFDKNIKKGIIYQFFLKKIINEIVTFDIYDKYDEAYSKNIKTLYITTKDKNTKNYYYNILKNINTNYKNELQKIINKELPNKYNLNKMKKSQSYDNIRLNGGINNKLKNTKKNTKKKYKNTKKYKKMQKNIKYTKKHKT
jgi:hypothetical protein